MFSALGTRGCLPKDCVGPPAPGLCGPGEHYVQGTTMGRLARQLGLHRGSLHWGPCTTWPPGWNPVPDRLVQGSYRRGLRSSTRMRRAGATMAGTDMRGASLHAAPEPVPLPPELLRQGGLGTCLAKNGSPGTLVIDRYAAYNKNFMLQAVLLMPTCCGKFRIWARGICRAARGATVCGDVGMPACWRKP